MHAKLGAGLVLILAALWAAQRPWIVVLLLAVVAGAALPMVWGRVRRPTTANTRALTLAQRLARGLARRARMAESWSGGSAQPFFGVQARSRGVNELLDRAFALLMRDYVSCWSVPLLGADAMLSSLFRKKLWDAVDSLQVRLGAVDVLTFLTRDVVVALCSHLQTVRQSPRHAFPSHPCLVSKEAELTFLRQAATVLLRVVFRPADTDSTVTCTLLREVLANKVLYATINQFADPDYINQYLLYKCEQRAQAAQRRRGIYEYAQTYAGFLRIINATDSIRDLQEIRHNIIAELMQAAHIRELKQMARRVPQSVPIDAFMEASDKAVLLHSRNLKRYINQLRNAKITVERRIYQLGGPSYEGARTVGRAPGETSPSADGAAPKSTLSSDLNKALSLSEILVDGMALGFFLQYLQQHRAGVNLKFWLACKNLQETVERRGSVPVCDVLSCMEVYLSGRKIECHVQVCS